MGHFIGGSAYAMANQVADGYVLVTERTFQRLGRAELDALGFELDKKLREIRGETQPQDPLDVQKRNRRLQRLTNCRRMLGGYRQRHRK